MEEKIYLAYDAQMDYRYADTMKAWLQDDGTPFNFVDSFDVKRNLRLGPQESVRAAIQERVNSCSVFVLLAGENTRYPFKFLEWEIQSALGLDKSIIVINLNGSRFRDDMCCPELLQHALALHISFIQPIVSFALNTWPGKQLTLRENRTSYHYTENVYRRYNV